MSYQFLDIPRYIEPKIYENTVDKIVSFLKKDKAVQSIYRLGNVNHPGISDLDIIAVFKNESSTSINPDDFFDTTERYLVTHDLAGASEDYFKKILPYTFWDNLNCIWGEDHLSSTSVQGMKLENEEVYKEQIGLEFLIKNFLDITVQRKYGVIKLRSLLQEIKGVRYDLKFLRIEGQEINDLMSHFLQRLDHWFETPFDAKEFSRWLSNYYRVLKETINTLTEKGQLLWIPQENHLKYGRNVFLHKAEQLKSKTSGLFLPGALISGSKKKYNAHQRLNKFNVDLVFTTEDTNNVHAKRLNTFREYKQHNDKHYPHFGVLTSSLADHFI